MKNESVEEIEQELLVRCQDVFERKQAGPTGILVIVGFGDIARLNLCMEDISSFLRAGLRDQGFQSFLEALF